MDFQTPMPIAKYMSSLVPDNVSRVLEPTPGEGNLSVALHNDGYYVFEAFDFWEINGSYECIVMNPPFTPMSLGYKILFRCMEMTDRIVALMPWLTIINSERRTKQILDYGLLSVTHLPRSVFKGSRVQCCIFNMERGYRGLCAMQFISTDGKILESEVE